MSVGRAPQASSHRLAGPVVTRQPRCSKSSGIVDLPSPTPMCLLSGEGEAYERYLRGGNAFRVKITMSSSCVLGAQL